MKKVSRRSFLFSAGAATTAAFTLPLISMHENEEKYAGKKLNIALVGLEDMQVFLQMDCRNRNTANLQAL